MTPPEQGSKNPKLKEKVSQNYLEVPARFMKGQNIADQPPFQALWKRSKLETVLNGYPDFLKLMRIAAQIRDTTPANLEKIVSDRTYKAAYDGLQKKFQTFENFGEYIRTAQTLFSEFPNLQDYLATCWGGFSAEFDLKGDAIKEDTAHSYLDHLIVTERVLIAGASLGLAETLPDGSAAQPTKEDPSIPTLAPTLTYQIVQGKLKFLTNSKPEGQKVTAPQLPTNRMYRYHLGTRVIEVINLG